MKEKRKRGKKEVGKGKNLENRGKADQREERSLEHGRREEKSSEQDRRQLGIQNRAGGRKEFKTGPDRRKKS